MTILCDSWKVWSSDGDNLTSTASQPGVYEKKYHTIVRVHLISPAATITRVFLSLRFAICQLHNATWEGSIVAMKVQTFWVVPVTLQ